MKVNTMLRDIDDIRLCMEMSCEVYDDTRTSSNRYFRVKGRFDGQTAISETTCGKLVVAFRGTESITDWLVNMTRFRRPFKCLNGAAVHAGFLMQHDAMWDRVIEHVLSYKDKYTNILVTGHSLGGALATLFSARIACLHPSLSISCYTFGTPRVGNMKFVDGIHRLPNLSIMRVNNSNDIVTWVPFCGFWHTPEVVTIPVRNYSWYEYKKRHSMVRMYSIFMKDNALDIMKPTRNRLFGVTI